MSFYLGSFSNGLFGGLREMANYWSQDLANQNTYMDLQNRIQMQKQGQAAVNQQNQQPPATTTTGGDTTTPGAPIPMSPTDVATIKTTTPLDRDKDTTTVAGTQGVLGTDRPGVTSAVAGTAGTQGVLGTDRAPPPAPVPSPPGGTMFAGTGQRYTLPPANEVGTPPAVGVPSSPIAAVPPLNQMFDPVTGMTTNVAPPTITPSTATPIPQQGPAISGPGLGPGAAQAAPPAPPTGYHWEGTGANMQLRPNTILPPAAGQPMSLNVAPALRPRSVAAEQIGSPLSQYY